MATWHEQIDNTNIVQPSAIANKDNGSDAIKGVCHPILDHQGKQVGLLAPVAARSYNAMVQAAWAEGVVLVPSGPEDSFRPLATQTRLFNSRYTLTNTGIKGRVCGGKTYYFREHGLATVACIGTSNHGKAGAVDFDLDEHGALAWLEKHAKSFGWQWEVSTEAWHLHYMLGDAITPAVTAAESHHPTPPKEDDMFDDDDRKRAVNIEKMLNVLVRDNTTRLVRYANPKGGTADYVVHGNEAKHVNQDALDALFALKTYEAIGFPPDQQPVDVKYEDGVDFIDGPLKSSLPAK